jgi:DNA topoisomerase-1
MYIVIVESPSKCKTIESYLGDNYHVIATCGHFRSLTKLEQINLDTMEIKYSITKSKIVSMLKAETMNHKGRIILATDNDREGESIAWHICMVCGLPLNTPRIIFHEITKDAIQKAIMNPTILDLNKVYSQQCRQILDLYIGYTISPILWKYIQHKLSAGRCQTPALKMLYEQEERIRNQSYETHYKVTATYKNIEFHLTKHLTQEELQVFFQTIKKIKNKDENSNTKSNTESKSNSHNQCVGLECILEKRDPTKHQYSPPAILITSSLQKGMSMSPKQIMMCAQTLYEHGLITYMRTDTAAYSKDFVDKANKHISLHYGKDYCGTPNTNVATHEGIRVTDLSIPSVNFDQNVNRVYEYIYKHTLQSCMSTSIYSQTHYDVDINDNENENETYTFRYTSLQPIFHGWKILNKENNDSINLNFIKQITFSTIKANEQCTNIQLHYTESQLISRLEKENIGRPSTYTSILDSIEKYVNKGKIETTTLDLTHYTLHLESIHLENINETKKIEENNKLSLTNLGSKVTEFCYKYFDLFEYSYTKDMELFLDNVSVGNDWTTILRQTIDKITSCKKIKINEVKPEYKSLHCGLYKKHPLIIKNGPHGYYIEYNKKCISLNALDEVHDVSIWIKEGIDGENFNENSHSDSDGHSDGHDDENVNDIMSQRKNILIEYMKQNEKNQKENIQINETMSIRKGKDDKGYYLFFKTKKMTKPKFFNIPDEYVESTENVSNEEKIDKIKEYIQKKYKLIC